MAGIIKVIKENWKAFALVSFFMLMYIIFLIFDLSQYISVSTIKNSVMSTGDLGPLIFILIMIVAIIISPIPSLPLTISSGFIWGPVLGTIYSVIGATIGATISFLIAKYAGKDSINKLLGENAIFCRECTEKSLFYIILFSRLIPFFQFDIISYGAGLTNIRLWKFTVATFIGMIPTTYLFVKFGSVIAVESWLSISISIILIIGIFTVPVLFKNKLRKYVNKGS